MDNIIGNEQAKRACEIAIKGKLKILFIGKGEAEDFVLYLAKEGIEAKALQPCKCGYLGDERIVCTCKPEQIAKQRYIISNISRHWADMVVETHSPHTDKVKKWLEENYKILDNESISLLEMGYKNLNLTTGELNKIINVAITIASLDSSKVLVQHIAEALQYRSRK